MILFNPNLLLLKLFHYGFDNDSMGLLSNYFKDRSQVVKIKEHKSGPVNLKLGVPQGSILGPLFFLIFINDLAFILKRLKTKYFADDTTLYKSGTCLIKLIDDFVQELNELMNWCKFNMIDINWSKTPPCLLYVPFMLNPYDFSMLSMCFISHLLKQLTTYFMFLMFSICYFFNSTKKNMENVGLIRLNYT